MCENRHPERNFDPCRPGVAKFFRTKEQVNNVTIFQTKKRKKWFIHKKCFLKNS